MKIILISDTHTFHNYVNMPEGDVLVHAGDLAGSGRLEEVQDALNWLNAQPQEYVLCVAGNHDWALQKYKDRLSFGRVKYLEDEGLTINGVKFYGSPWQPEFMNWAFNLERGEPLKAKWDLIPRDTNVLITHSPPAAIRDTVRPFGKYLRTSAGCDDLFTAVQEIKPQVHVFGHIHSGYGMTKLGETEFYNASICDEAYRPKNAPFVVEVG